MQVFNVKNQLLFAKQQKNSNEKQFYMDFSDVDHKKNAPPNAYAKVECS